MNSRFVHGWRLAAPLTMAAWAAVVLFAIAPLARAQILLHYKFDETSGTTAADSSGNGTDGTLNGFSFDTGSVAGIHGTGLDFDGTNDFVDAGVTDVNHPSALDPNGEATIMAWLKVDDWPTAQSIATSSILDPGRGLRFSMGPDDAHGGGVTFRYVNAGTGVDAGFEANTQALTNSTYNHFAFTMDPNGIDTVFVNGDPVTPVNTTNRWGPGLTPHLHVGSRDNPGSERFFDGSIDDYAIVEGKLTEMQIEGIIANGVASLIGPACDFDGGGCGLSDINLMMAQGDLVAGVGVSSGNQFDLDGDNDIDGDDITEWLSLTGTANGYGSPMLRGDTDNVGNMSPTSRTVDITDFQGFLDGFTGAGSTWEVGNFNGDGVVDITDFSNNFLPNFVATGGGTYGAGQSVPEPSTVLLFGLGGLVMVYLCCRRTPMG